MADVTAQMIKEMRQKTGAGISLCKEALVESGGDFEQAELYIRKKDKDKAAKKSERATGEGVVFVRIDDAFSTGVLVEIACETDFAARNEQFQELGEEMLNAVMDAGDLTDASSLTVASGKTVAARVEEAVATIGENMRLRRVARLKAPEGGAVGSYRHFNNKAGSLVSLELEGLGPDNEQVQALARDICMHITSCRPQGLREDDIPEEVRQREREVHLEEVQGKPEEIQQKILAGKMGKFLAGICLDQQPFVKDESVKVADHVAKVLKDAGGAGRLAGFVRFELGAGAVNAGGELNELGE
jgi:elongation factor Ts